MFGAEVHGTNTTVLRWMRSTAARLSPGGGNGAHVATVLALHSQNDPARRALLGPINRYAEEIWAISDTGLRNRKHLGPDLLLGGVKKIKAEANKKKRVTRRGPLSSMLIGLDFLGWTLETPTVVLNHREEELHLTAGDPRRLRQQMERRLEEQLEEEAT